MTQIKSKNLNFLTPNKQYDFSENQISTSTSEKASNYFNSFFNQFQLPLFILNTKGRIVKYNRKAKNLFNCDKDTMRNKSFIHLLAAQYEVSNDSITKIEKNIHRSLPESDIAAKMRFNGTEKYITLNFSKIKTDDGDSQIFIACKDMTANQSKLNSLTQQLQNKSIQMQEIHHRIKNNLQLINSILNLEYSRHKPHNSQTAKSIIKESQNKIFTISLIHQNLYNRDSFEKIDSKQYFQQLFNYVNSLYNQDKKNIEVTITDQWKFVPIEESIYIGLILDEIFTNSFKHAFQNKSSGKLFISLKKNKNYAILRAGDDGPGFNPKTRKRNSFGMELIETLVRQLKGHLALTTDNGTNYTIKLPAFDYERE